MKWIETKNPNETSKELVKIFPKKEWKNVNKILVGFGQSICAARKPLCSECPINKICEADENYTKKKTKKVKKVQYDDEMEFDEEEFKEMTKSN